MAKRGTLNNRQRAAQAAHRRMDAVTMARLPNGSRVPLRYLAPDERRDLLKRATSPL